MTRKKITKPAIVMPEANPEIADRVKEIVGTAEGHAEARAAAVLIRQFQFIARRHDLLLDKWLGSLAAGGIPLAEVAVMREKEINFVNQALQQLASEP